MCVCAQYKVAKFQKPLFIFVTFQCDVDMAAIAYSYVYFEKLVLMVSITSPNLHVSLTHVSLAVFFCLLPPLISFNYTLFCSFSPLL